MKETSLPQTFHLVIRSFATDERFCEFAWQVAGHARTLSCQPYLAARLHECRFLEPNSTCAHVAVIACPSKNAARALWSKLQENSLIDLVDTEKHAQCILVPNLPEEGLPDPSIPTAANTAASEDHGKPAFMIIEGSVSDQLRIDQYRAIILPMIGQRRAFYSVFAFADEVEVLRGKWPHQVFIISQWNAISSALDFWLSDRYQREAIPTRTGAGTFEVMLTDANCSHVDRRARDT
jgi:uncharacterized protein (DUF1330 family)